jgi:hypothetical protein
MSSGGLLWHEARTNKLHERPLAVRTAIKGETHRNVRKTQRLYSNDISKKK